MSWDKKLTNFIGSKTSVVLHTIFFIVMFLLPLFGIPFDRVMLILTTAVSLEAIYLAIFIQISVNENTESLHEVEEDIDEIQEDVDEIQQDVDEIQEDVNEIQGDVDEIESDIDEIQEDVSQDKGSSTDLDTIRVMLGKLIEEVDRLKKQHNN